MPFSNHTCTHTIQPYHIFHTQKNLKREKKELRRKRNVPNQKQQHEVFISYSLCLFIDNIINNQNKK